MKISLIFKPKLILVKQEFMTWLNSRCSFITISVFSAKRRKDSEREEGPQNYSGMYCSPRNKYLHHIFCNVSSTILISLNSSPLLLLSHQALEEIKDFMIIKGLATKERQKLMRNLRVSYPVRTI